MSLPFSFPPHSEGYTLIIPPRATSYCFLYLLLSIILNYIQKKAKRNPSIPPPDSLPPTPE